GLSESLAAKSWTEKSRAAKSRAANQGETEMPKHLTRRQAPAIPAGALASLAGRTAMAADPVKVGLVAALSGPSAKSGEGITRVSRSRSMRSMRAAACSGDA